MQKIINIKNIYQIPDKDILTYSLLKTGLTGGIFQYENVQLLGPLLKKAVTECIDDMAAMASIIRPGTLNYKFDGESATNHYVKRSCGEEDDIFDPPQLEEILNETHGLFLYQEQAISAAKKLAGFSGSEAMTLQKAISKKKADIIIQLKPLFIKGCVSKGMSQEDAENIYNQIETSNRYSFNKCLEENTLVPTRFHGIRKIKDIYIGETIFSHSAQLCSVINKYNNGIINCIKITCQDGEVLECSINHKIKCKYGILPLYMILGLDIPVICGGKIISVEDVGPKQCYDLEVDSKDHLFLANGIFVSNSHAVSYSYISYVCAYLKAHYLKEFMMATLRFAKHKIDHYNEIEKLVKECKLFGLDIRPPSIINHCTEFTYINGAIYFGLSDIKGVGEGQAEKLVAAVKNIDINNWYQVLMSIKDLNKTTVQNTILVGAFSHIKMARRKMLDDYQNLRLLTKGEMAWVNENWANFESLPKLIEGLLPHATKQRADKLNSLLQLILDPAESLKDSVEDITAAERELLGANVSFNNIDKIERLGNTTVQEFKEGKTLKQHTIVAEIKNIKQHIIKSGNSAGKTMVFLSILDQTAEMDAVVFANTYEEYGGFLSLGRCLTFIGVRSDKGSFVINEIKEIK